MTFKILNNFQIFIWLGYYNIKFVNMRILDTWRLQKISALMNSHLKITKIVVFKFFLASFVIVYLNAAATHYLVNLNGNGTQIKEQRGHNNCRRND